MVVITHDVHKNLYITLFLPAIFICPDYCGSHPTLEGAADSKKFLSSEHEELHISPETLLRRHSFAQPVCQTFLYASLETNMIVNV